jgi:DnaD/phage-associated family protein
LIYKINRDFEGRVFPVPDFVVDDCVKLADPKWVKVILYIFRHQHDCDFDVGKIAAALGTGIDAEDVETALSYWKEVGVIAPNGETKSFDADTSVKALPDEKPERGLSDARRRERDIKSLTPVEIADRVGDSKELGFLIKSVEDIYGRVPNHTEQRTLVHIFDYYGLPADILLMIISYCKSEDIKGIAAVESIAGDWYEKGVKTHKQADAEIKRMQQRRTLAGKIKSKLEINRGLTPKEKAFADDWADKRITVELITLAYEKTIAATGKLSFNYMNTILIGWHNSGYKNASQVEQADREYDANKKRPQKSRREASENELNITGIIEHSLNHVPIYKSRRKSDKETV